MPTPSSGQISLSDIAWIVYNNYSTQTSLSHSDVRSLLGVSSGQIRMSNAYSKPPAGNTGGTYYTPGNYSWAVVPYQTLYAQIAGGGGAGGGGCGGQIFYYGCVNFCPEEGVNTNGNSGGASNFNGVVASGGNGGEHCGGTPGTNGGNNQNGNTGGGGAGGNGHGFPGGTDCNQSGGARGGDGGFVEISWRKGSNGPGYASTINFAVGAGGSGVSAGCRPAPGNPGSSGWVYIAWS